MNSFSCLYSAEAPSNPAQANKASLGLRDAQENAYQNEANLRVCERMMRNDQWEVDLPAPMTLSGRCPPPSSSRRLGGRRGGRGVAAPAGGHGPDLHRVHLCASLTGAACGVACRGAGRALGAPGLQ